MIIEVRQAGGHYSGLGRYYAVDDDVGHALRLLTKRRSLTLTHLEGLRQLGVEVEIVETA